VLYCQTFTSNFSLNLYFIYHSIMFCRSIFLRPSWLSLRAVDLLAVSFKTFIRDFFIFLRRGPGNFFVGLQIPKILSWQITRLFGPYRDLQTPKPQTNTGLLPLHPFKFTGTCLTIQ